MGQHNVFGRPAQTIALFGTGVTCVETRPPVVVANIALCLIHQTNYLVDQQLRRLEKDFVEHGGLRERMTRARLQERERQRNGQ